MKDACVIKLLNKLRTNASELGKVIRSAARGAPDDLAKLTGVGPQLVKKLNDAGVFHYWQIGAMTTADVEKLDADLKLNGRIQRDGWVEQACSTQPSR